MPNKPPFAHLPGPLEPVFVTPDVNAPVALFDGPVELIQTGGASQKRHVSISLEWLPTPRIRVHADGSFDFDLLGQGYKLRMPDGREFEVLWTNHEISGGAGAGPPRASGVLVSDENADSSRLDSIVFHLANGPEYMGRRATMESPPWRIVLDALPPWTEPKARKRLNALAGYAITHVGRLERTDGAPFTWADADAALEALGVLLSFARGAWTTPMLLVGKESETGARRDVWRLGGVDARTTQPSWFNQLSNEGFQAFGGLSSKLGDSVWAEPINHALHWFLIGNKPDVVMIEGAIVLQQAAFELLAWTLLVEDRKVLSNNGMEKLRASEQIRRLLSECGIPLAVPGQLGDLEKIAKAENWQDGPHATTEIRNAIVHASPKRRTRILAHGHDARREAWMLGQWYLELILLRVFDYTGHYSNRLKASGTWRGTEVEPVPWAS